MTRTWPGCWSSGRCGRRRGWRGPAAPRGGSAAAAGGRRGRAGAAAALPGAGKAGDGSPGPGGRGPRAWWRMAGAVFLPPRLWVRVGGFQSRGERPHPARLALSRIPRAPAPSQALGACQQPPLAEKSGFFQVLRDTHFVTEGWIPGGIFISRLQSRCVVVLVWCFFPIFPHSNSF